MKTQIAQYIEEYIRALGVSVVADVSVPENPAHGDYSTNVAMKLARELKKAPLQIAEELKEKIIQDQKASKLPWLDRVEVAAPGFINLYLSEASLVTEIGRVLTEGETYGKGPNPASEAGNEGEKAGAKKAAKSGQKEGKTGGKKVAINGQKTPLISRIKPAQTDLAHSGKHIMVEFAHPNTHKSFHIGHLRNITTGESVVRLLEAAGNTVTRVNYQGDVGMHIAKALYGLTRVAPYKDELQSVTGIQARVAFLGKAYAAGSKAFEEDEGAKGEMKDLNALVYAAAQRFAKEKGEDPGTTDYLGLVKPENRVRVEEIYALWKETRQWSLDYFDMIYKRVYTHYDRFYFESECLSGADIAKDAVKQGVLEESDGAIILNGKKHSIDTRVFVNSLGLPTYEAKELALCKMETTEFGHIDRLIHVVGPEQASFFKVTFKTQELLGIVEPGVQYHLAYGWVKLKQGKMSSRLGNVVLGEDIIQVVKDAIYDVLLKNESNYKKEEQDEIAEKTAIAAIKYSFLKVGTSSEIAFDIEESINTHGDSGPYLQYTYARARSVLRKSGFSTINDSPRFAGEAGLPSTISSDERLLARAIAQFPDIVSEAAANLAPSTVCTYLFQLAQQFNAFYAGSPIAGNDTRLALTAATAQVLKNGLYLLGIEVLEQM